MRGRAVLRPAGMQGAGLGLGEKGIIILGGDGYWLCSTPEECGNLKHTASHDPPYTHTAFIQLSLTDAVNLNS